jgi:putative transcriptional regulator
MTKPIKPAVIKRERARLGLTQTQAARRIGYTLRAWQQWEGGQRSMRASLWQAFLNYRG